MSVYVMSDIHGYYDAFQTMLKKIDFSDEDELIIAGDYIDRGPQSLEMLRWMESCPDNILLLKGNHDEEFSACINVMCSYARILELEEDIEDTQTLYNAMIRIPEVWGADFDYYGTIGSLVMKRRISLEELRRFVDVIDTLPYFYKRTVEDKRYIIVHAGYYEDKNVSQKEKESFYLYAREEAYFLDGGVPDHTIIAGHTPTISKYTPMYTGGEVFKYINDKKKCAFYDIDCGCGYRDVPNSGGRLACMRLGDEEIFYV